MVSFWKHNFNPDLPLWYTQTLLFKILMDSVEDYAKQ